MLNSATEQTRKSGRGSTDIIRFEDSQTPSTMPITVLTAKRDEFAPPASGKAASIIRGQGGLR